MKNLPIRAIIIAAPDSTAVSFFFIMSPSGFCPLIDLNRKTVDSIENVRPVSGRFFPFLCGFR